MKQFYSLVLLISLLSSCNYNKPKKIVDITKISLSKIKKVDFDDLFSGTGKRTQLESQKDIMLGDDLHFYFYNNDIYVLDKSRKKLLRFNVEGKFLNSIGKIGKGPDELISIDDYFVDSRGVTILVRSGGFNAKIIVYSFDGHQKHTGIIHDFIGLSIEGYNGQYLLYTGFNKFKHTHRLYRMDSALNIIDTYLKNDFSDKLIPLIENNFSKFEKRLFFKESILPVIYKITEKDLMPVYQFDFGEYSIPEKFWNMDGIKGFQMLFKHGFASIRYYFQNDHYAFFVIVIQKEKEKTRIYFIINNRETSEWKMAEKFDEETFNYKTPVGINEQDELLFMGYPDLNSINMNENVNNMDIKNPEIKYYKILQ